MFLKNETLMDFLDVTTGELVQSDKVVGKEEKKTSEIGQIRSQNEVFEKDVMNSLNSEEFDEENQHFQLLKQQQEEKFEQKQLNLWRIKRT